MRTPLCRRSGGALDLRPLSGVIKHGKGGRAVDRSGEQEALGEQAAESLQLGELLRGLDAFRHGPQAKALAHSNDAAGKRGRGAVRSQAVDEAAIDLDRVDREMLQVAVGREP